MSEQEFMITKLSALAVEYWKLASAFEKAISTLPPDKCKGPASQLRFSRIQLEAITSECGFRLVSFDGEIFHSGLPASGDNLSDFDEDAELIVMKTLEPAIIRNMSVVSKGRVLLAEKGNE